MLAQAYNIIIYCGVVAPGRGIDVGDDLNATEKNYINVNRKRATDQFQRV